MWEVEAFVVSCENTDSAGLDGISRESAGRSCSRISPERSQRLPFSSANADLCQIGGANSDAICSHLPHLPIRLVNGNEIFRQRVIRMLRARNRLGTARRAQDREPRGEDCYFDDFSMRSLSRSNEIFALIRNSTISSFSTFASSSFT
jgi:hypothetical protein